MNNSKRIQTMKKSLIKVVTSETFLSLLFAIEIVLLIFFFG